VVLSPVNSTAPLAAPGKSAKPRSNYCVLFHVTKSSGGASFVYDFGSLQTGKSFPDPCTDLFAPPMRLAPMDLNRARWDERCLQIPDGVAICSRVAGTGAVGRMK
jgi:hypothetical protein